VANVLKKAEIGGERGEDVRPRVTTAPIGQPLPIGLRMATISGTTPWRANPHMPSPVRPKPGCTSSALSAPPAVRVTSTTALTKPGGSVNTPSDEKMESTSKPANLMSSPRGHALTHRESQIMLLVSGGISNKEMGVN
jgi:hypothetical protein